MIFILHAHIEQLYDDFHADNCRVDDFEIACDFYCCCVNNNNIADNVVVDSMILS